MTAIVEAPEPKTAMQVKSFAGMVNYYAKFIPRLSILMSPLYAMLKKDARFVWTNKCASAFEAIKKVIVSDQVLVHFDPSKPIVLSCDASQVGVAAALSHSFPDGSLRPIAFASRSLAKAEENYAMIDKEALAIFFGVKKFQQYLLGNAFVLRTDHKPLLAIFGEHRGIPVMAASRLQRWAFFLSGFNYSIQYINGISNQPADYLSRAPLLAVEDPAHSEVEVGTYLNFIEGFQAPIDAKLIRSETLRDPQLKIILDYVNSGWPEHMNQDELKSFYTKRNELTVECGCLMWGYRVVIPTLLRKDLLKELHVGHMGIVKMKAVARSYFWWPGLDNSIEQVAKSCEACLKTRDNPPRMEVIPWPLPSEPWERVHVDFLGPIMSSYFLIVLDAHSKWVEVFKMTSITSSQTILKLRETFARFGLPRLLVSDNGTQFVSREFQFFLTMNGIEHITSPTFYPASNGAAENAVKNFKKAMEAAIIDSMNKGKPVETLMSRFLLMYRNAPHCTTKRSPAEMMFGRSLRTRLDSIKLVKDKADNTKEQHAGNQMGRRKVNFEVGDEVMVRDYRNINKVSWAAAVIRKKLGRVTYLCEVVDNGRIWKRHSNQIILRLRGIDGGNTGLVNKTERNDKRIVITECVNENDNVNDSINTSEEGPVLRRGERTRRKPERYGEFISH